MRPTWAFQIPAVLGGDDPHSLLSPVDGPGLFPLLFLPLAGKETPACEGAGVAEGEHCSRRWGEPGRNLTGLDEDQEVPG